MGARMTSQAAAQEALAGVRGLIFLGFPLHPAGAPATKRGTHLARVTGPMLFLQGERDKLADLSLLRPIVEALGARAALEVLAEADHSFAVPKRTGKTPADVLEGVAGSIARWVDHVG